MKSIFKNIISSLIISGIVLFSFSCTGSSSADKSEEDSKEISILYPNWAEGIAFTYLAKAALEDTGYVVNLTNLEPGLIYGELSKDDSKGDVMLDAWLPYTHAQYWADYGDKIDKLGESFSEGTTGLVVPSYVTINSIEELNENKDKFDGEIIGIGSGAGIHKNAIKAIEEYELDYEQITSSGPAMVASLEKAIKNEEWIVVTGWKPHFKWAKNDIKYLEDPKNVFPKDACTIVSRKGFKEEDPMAAKFFSNFNLEEEQLYELMEMVENKGDKEGTKEWYNKNKDLVKSWF